MTTGDIKLISKHLHDLEDDLIQISGLTKALIQLLPDGSEHTCVCNALEEKLTTIDKNFYELWKNLTDNTTSDR